jgi:butyryl-CoA dehydrogenase
MKTLQNKVIVITGAGQGIGRELAKLCAAQGAKLALNSRTKANLDETVSQLGDTEVFSKDFDISDKDAVFQFAEDVQAHYGQVDVLINNAGVAIGGLTFEELDLEDFEWIFSINYMGAIYATKAFLPLLKKQESGSSLVNISSLFGLVPMALKTPYCSTKYALTGFTDCLRMELLDTPVHVMGVYPGGVKTGVTLKAHKADKEPEYAQEFNKLLKMEPAKAAELIIKGLLKRKDKVIVGGDAKMAIFAQRNLPFLLRNMARKTMRKFKG